MFTYGKTHGEHPGRPEFKKRMVSGPWLISKVLKRKSDVPETIHPSIPSPARPARKAREVSAASFMRGTLRLSRKPWANKRHLFMVGRPRSKFAAQITGSCREGRRPAKFVTHIPSTCRRAALVEMMPQIPVLVGAAPAVRPMKLATQIPGTCMRVAPVANGDPNNQFL